MLERYDPRSDCRERADSWERSFGSRSGTSERAATIIRVTCSPATSTSLADATGSTCATVIASTRSMARRGGRWRRSAHFGSSPRVMQSPRAAY